MTDDPRKPPSAIAIRPATPADAAALARLNAAFNALTITPEQQAARLRATASTERALLAWDGDVAVGFACLQFVPLVTTGAPFAMLSELYIEPSRRRQGIARALVAEAEALARAFGAPGVILFTGLTNDVAQAFYRALGYADYALTFRKVF